LVLDTHQSHSLRAVLDRLLRLASQVRDRFSVDAWRILVRIDQHFNIPGGIETADLTDVLNLTNALVTDLAAIEGLAMESMTRTHVFRFLNLGRRLERALQTVGLLRSAFVGKHVLSDRLLESVLEIADSIMTYRSRYLANLQLAAVLDLLLTDETNPRSIAFQLMTLEELVEELPRDATHPGYSPHRRLVMSMIHAVRIIDIQQLSDAHRMGDYEQLDELLEFLARALPSLSNEISNRYLVHAGPARKLFTTLQDQ
jgi:uncharacterized alpha-E superfamily protein